MEPFWDLKIDENLTRASLTSCVLSSLISTTGQTSLVFMAYVIPWINTYNRACSMLRPPCMHVAVPCHDQSHLKLSCR